jgi:hypothetical protein
MNRYIGSALLPLLTRCAALFASTEHHAALIDSTLQTIYRLSKGRSLTKAQRDAIEECLLAVCKYAAPWNRLRFLCFMIEWNRQEGMGDRGEESTAIRTVP